MTLATIFLQPVVPCCNHKEVHHEKYICVLTGAQGLLKSFCTINQAISSKQHCHFQEINFHEKCGIVLKICPQMADFLIEENIVWKTFLNM
jgi:hypothetical protein